MVVVVSDPATAAVDENKDNTVLRSAFSFCFFLGECGDDRDLLPFGSPTDDLSTESDSLGECGDEDFCLVIPLFFLWEQDVFVLYLLLADGRECGCSGFDTRTKSSSSSLIFQSGKVRSIFGMVLCIETCIQFGASCGSKRSLGTKEIFRIGHVARSAELVVVSEQPDLLPSPKVAVSVVVAMSLMLFGVLSVVASICFLYHCLGEARRTGTVRA